MKQLLQNYRGGALRIAKVPMHQPKPNTVLVETACSLISVGTERYMIDLARKSLAGKALARPDLVKQVVNKVRSEGIGETIRQVQGRLDAPVPLGYSAAGVVIEVGDGVTSFTPGDRVACAGSGHASHAEILQVPHTLAVPVPSAVDLEAASFVAIGGIALHAVRTANVSLGEQVAVLGLGLLGQLAVQILNAAGCSVIGLDIVPAKVRAALAHGAHAGAVIGCEDVVTQVRNLSADRGVDAVLIFAGTDSNEPIELATQIVTERGRIVAPGLVGLDLPRKQFYEKEISFTVSRAWGPGMYDPEYESGVVNYPQPYVRWTAQGNMAQFLAMLADGHVAVEHLITHRYSLDQAVDAYEMILAGTEPVTGVILQYPGMPDCARTIRFRPEIPVPSSNGHRPTSNSRPKDLSPCRPVRIGLLGAGLFAKGTLLPALLSANEARLHAVACSTGTNCEHLARKHDMAYCTTDCAELLSDPEIDLIMVLTRHGSHAEYVCKALNAGKHVFVEKPLALDETQLQRVVEAYQRSPGQLMTGFNRRFAPATNFACKRLVRISGPLVINIRVNVGHIPSDSWIYDPVQGGGNLVGEVCHFVDLVQTLTGALPAEVLAQAVHGDNATIVVEDNIAVTLMMDDGSVATILYTTLGDKAVSRERIEIFGGGAVCVIDNFRSVNWTHAGKHQRMGGFWSGVDRGHRAEMQALVTALREGKPLPVPVESYVATTRATFAMQTSLQHGHAVTLES